MIHNLVITGIPRSGTSYLCTLMNSMENTVIVNEPPEVLQLLHSHSTSTLGEYYDRTRRSILAGVPIQNKIINGEFIQDTGRGDARSYYVPQVSDPAFIFGTKNTLVYLVCLGKLLRQIPDMKILACIRHPHDTVASWKQVAFPHLRNANPLFLKEYAGAREGSEIQRICDARMPEMRYALLWDFLARRIIEHLDDIVLFRYEDFVCKPAEHLARLYGIMGVVMRSKSGLPVSEAKRHRNVLSEAELDCLWKYCGISARRLGYEL